MFEFKITAKDQQTAARTGVFHTPHGSFRTPVFMPVGTYGAVKTITPAELRQCGAEIILGNTFHLHLRPGEATIKRFGGIQQFTSWDGPMLTDSGGYQVFSLAHRRKIYDDRVEFRAPLDGRKCVFTPRKVLQIQRDLGTDIAMQLDECAAADASRTVATQALDRTTRWAEESVKIWLKYREKQALFPIVQGVNYPDLRRQSADFCAGLPTPGVAIGGLAVGETKSNFLKTLEITMPRLPTSKPRYLMGVGEPADIVAAVARGCDMFDCVIPTRLARHGVFFDARGKRVSMRLAKFINDKKPLNKDCRCEACRNFTRGYLRHLVQTKEMLGCRLLTLHNLTYLFDLLTEIRASIRVGNFAQLQRKYAYSKY